MSAGFEAAGDIATGMMMGRAVERKAGEAASGAHRSGVCLNCGTTLIGEFCHACGQNGHVHKTLASIGHDLLHGAFHFEGKIWRTLPMLVLHPGALTRRYIAGERARFVSPLALFLFSVFLLFAVIHSLGGEVEGTMLNGTERSQTVSRLDESIAKAKADLAKARHDQATAATATARRDAADDAKGLALTLAGMEKARAGFATGDRMTTFTNIETGWPRLDEGIAHANANPGLALYKLQASAYKYSWALIPISVPFVALLFLWRRRYHLYDHTIFVIYSLDFMMLLVVVLSLAGAIGLSAGLITLAAFVVPPLHLYKQLRGAYALRRFSAAWRTMALVVFGFLALLLFFALLLGLGLMG